MASQAGKVPCRLNGSPIPNLGEVNVEGARNVAQRTTIGGVRNAKGSWKWKADLTFGLDAELDLFIARIDPTNESAPPVNLQVDIDRATYNLTNGDANSLAFSSDQDGKADCKVSLMFEGWDKVG